MTNRFYFGNILIDNMKIADTTNIAMTPQEQRNEQLAQTIIKNPPQGRHVVVLVGENLGY